MIKTKTMRDCAFYCLNLKVCLYVCIYLGIEVKVDLFFVADNLVSDKKILNLIDSTIGSNVIINRI